MKIYELKNVKKYYGPSLALDIGSLSLRQGAFYIFHGPNGAGKTTLLNLLAFLDRPSAGEILFDGGRLPGKIGPGRPIRDVTLVMQNPYFFRTTVMKNVTRGLSFRRMRTDEILRTAGPVMKKLGLWKLRERNVASLSGGEKRKVALARALVLGTKVLLLDEPTAHLDKAHVDVIEEVVSELPKNGERTVIMTTHDLAQTCRLTRDVIFLVEGRMTGTPLWNFFAVELKGTGAVKTARLAPQIDVFAAADRTGAASIAINPRDIILSEEPIHSSALNSLRGKITAISDASGLIDVAVSVGVTLHSFITRRSLDEMKLAVGQVVFLTFKASAVEVF